MSYFHLCIPALMSVQCCDKPLPFEVFSVNMEDKFCGILNEEVNY